MLRLLSRTLRGHNPRRRWARRRTPTVTRAVIETLEERRLLSLAAATDLAISAGVLSWSDNSTSETAYQVEYRWEGRENFHVLLDPTSGQPWHLPPDTASVSVPVPPQDHTYVYRVRTLGPGAQSLYSEELAVWEPPANVGGPISNLSLRSDSGSWYLDFDIASSTAVNVLLETRSGQSAEPETWRDWGGAQIQPTHTQMNVTWWVGAFGYPATDLRLRVAGGADDGLVTNTLSVPAPQRSLAAPSNLTQHYNQQNRLVLEWTGVTGATSYTIYHAYGMAPLGSWSASATGTSHTFYPGEEWPLASFVVAASNGWNTSNFSNTSTAPIVPPAAPADLHGGLVSTNQVRLVWSNVPDNESGYRIERKEAGDPNFPWVSVGSVEADQTSFVDTLPGNYNGKLYDYQVFAFNPAGDSDPVMTTASGVVLQGVGFTGVRMNSQGQVIGFSIQHIKRDVAQTEYVWPQWWDANGDGVIEGEASAYLNHTIDIAGQPEHRYPVSYRRSDAAGDSYMQLRAWLQYEGAVEAGWRFKATGGGYVFTESAFVGASNPQVVMDTTTRIPEHIDSKYITFTWEMSVDDGATWFTLGSNSNHIYVTGAAADGAFETVLHLGSEGAKGLNPDTQATAVVDGVWGMLEGNSTYRVDGKEMQYHHESGTGMTAAGMLGHTDGKGQCTAWAQLMVGVLAAQGMSASTLDLQSRPIRSESGLVVKAMPAQGSGDANYTYWGTDRNHAFRFHQIVLVDAYPNRVYDPSYGVYAAGASPTAAHQAYEDQALDEFWDGSNWQSNTAAEDLLYL